MAGIVNGSRQMNSTGLRAHGSLSRIQIIVGSNRASDPTTVSAASCERHFDRLGQLVVLGKRLPGIPRFEVLRRDPDAVAEHRDQREREDHTDDRQHDPAHDPLVAGAYESGTHRNHPEVRFSSLL